jgi:hypothetical protein
MGGARGSLKGNILLPLKFVSPLLGSPTGVKVISEVSVLHSPEKSAAASAEAAIVVLLGDTGPSIKPDFRGLFGTLKTWSFPFCTFSFIDIKGPMEESVITATSTSKPGSSISDEAIMFTILDMLSVAVAGSSKVSLSLRASLNEAALFFSSASSSSELMSVAIVMIETK